MALLVVDTSFVGVSPADQHGAQHPTENGSNDRSDADLHEHIAVDMQCLDGWRDSSGYRSVSFFHSGQLGDDGCQIVGERGGQEPDPHDRRADVFRRELRDHRKSDR